MPNNINQISHYSFDIKNVTKSHEKGKNQYEKALLSYKLSTLDEYRFFLNY